MAEMQSRKRKSTVLDEQDHDQQSSTPTGHPARKKTKITQAQKQALIDNLQLESKFSHCLQSWSILTSWPVSYRTRPSPARPLCPSILRPSISHRKAHKSHSDEPTQSQYGRAFDEIF
jgi:hypothetical protein